MKKEEKLHNAILDIQLIYKYANEIGWYDFYEYSIIRCLYFATLVYEFVKEGNENSLFSDVYFFNVNSRGPNCDIISEAINKMEANEILVETDNKLILENNMLSDYMVIPNSQEREEWLGDIIYIFGIFGEEKLYDFIFRDPEYINTVKSKKKSGINTNSSNYTIKKLEEFQMDFNKVFGKKIINNELDNRQYLKLYFEFIFSKVLKGEA